MSKLRSGTYKTKTGALFWKSHCATCSPACVIVYHVTRSCGAYFVTNFRSCRQAVLPRVRFFKFSVQVSVWLDFRETYHPSGLRGKNLSPQSLRRKLEPSRCNTPREKLYQLQTKSAANKTEWSAIIIKTISNMLRVKLDVLENALDNWKRRKPAVSGKINFVKSVGLLKLISLLCAGTASSWKRL